MNLCYANTPSRHKHVLNIKFNVLEGEFFTIIYCKWSGCVWRHRLSITQSSTVLRHPLWWFSIEIAGIPKRWCQNVFVCCQSLTCNFRIMIYKPKESPTFLKCMCWHHFIPSSPHTYFVQNVIPLSPLHPHTYRPSLIPWKIHSIYLVEIVGLMCTFNQNAEMKLRWKWFHQPQEAQRPQRWLQMSTLAFEASMKVRNNCKSQWCLNVVVLICHCIYKKVCINSKQNPKKNPKQIDAESEWRKWQKKKKWWGTLFTLSTP